MKRTSLCIVALLFIIITLTEAFGVHVSIGKGGKMSLDNTIVAMGDSLTEGFGVKIKEAYPARLERKLQEAGYRWKVVNAGISGETSDESLKRLQHVLDMNPSIVILEIGVNDGFMGVDPQIIRANIEKIVHILTDRKIMVILAGMRMFDNIRMDYNNSFAGIYPEVAQKHRLIFIPHFLEGVVGDPVLNRLDGIHPNPNGYRVVVDNIFPYIKNAIELKEMERN